MLLFVDACAMPQHHQFAALLRAEKAMAASAVVNDSVPKSQSPSPEPSLSPGPAAAPTARHVNDKGMPAPGALPAEFRCPARFTTCERAKIARPQFQPEEHSVMKHLKWLVAFVMVVAFTWAARAEERGTTAEAKQMVQEALAHIKEVGPAKAFVDFNTPGGKWHKKDIYLFCYDLQGTCTCQGANKAQIGKNLIDIRTADGQLFVQNLIEIAKTKGSDWIDYQWPHPVSKKMEAKRAWIAKVPGESYLIGAGAYK